MTSSKLSEKENLENRLRDIIINTCNKIGCGNCGLEWTENGRSECSATDLQGKIMAIELSQKSNKN